MTNPNALLHRRDVVNELLRDRADLLVIAGLGAPNWDVSAAGDHPNNFPLWGAMGIASLHPSYKKAAFSSPALSTSLRAQRSNPSIPARSYGLLRGEPVIGRAFARPVGSQ